MANLRVQKLANLLFSESLFAFQCPDQLFFWKRKVRVLHHASLALVAVGRHFGGPQNTKQLIILCIGVAQLWSLEMEVTTFLTKYLK